MFPAPRSQPHTKPGVAVAKVARVHSRLAAKLGSLIYLVLALETRKMQGLRCLVDSSSVLLENH